MLTLDTFGDQVGKGVAAPTQKEGDVNSLVGLDCLCACLRFIGADTDIGIDIGPTHIFYGDRSPTLQLWAGAFAKTRPNWNVFIGPE